VTEQLTDAELLERSIQALRGRGCVVLLTQDEWVAYDRAKPDERLGVLSVQDGKVHFNGQEV